jgi:DNA-binding LacI/PurR family transcriptional regulator
MQQSQSHVTMREVADDAGVSLKTVSNVVNNYEFVSDAMREKVNESIKKLGYTVNTTARNLRRGRHGVISLVVPDLRMPYFAELSSLVIAEAKKVGLQVLVEPTLYSRESELEALHGELRSMTDGLIFSPLELGPEDEAEFDVEYPLVVLGERVVSDNVDYVGTENVAGVKRATSYLLQTGCKRVAVLGAHPGERMGTAQLRLQGYMEALDEHGIPFDPDLVVTSVMWHRVDGVEAMEGLFDKGVEVDGVMALNDMLASGALHAIQMRGLRIPDDISVIGFDNSEDSQYFSPALTSVSPGLPAVAKVAVRTICERIEGVEPQGLNEQGHVHREVGSQLILRDSTRKLNVLI